MLAGMRKWIDRHGGDPVKFDSASTSQGDIRVRLEFSQDEIGSAFQRDWIHAVGTEAALTGLAAV
jgi:hypothetical protein